MAPQSLHALSQRRRFPVIHPYGPRPSDTQAEIACRRGAFWKAAGWLPAELDVDKSEWNRRKARIGDCAEVARMVRNLVHPERYMADHPGGRSTLSRLRWQVEVVKFCREWLLAHVRRSLRAQMEAEGLLSARKSRTTRSGGKALDWRYGCGSVRLLGTQCRLQFHRSRTAIPGHGGQRSVVGGGRRRLCSAVHDEV